MNPAYSLVLLAAAAGCASHEEPKAPPPAPVAVHWESDNFKRVQEATPCIRSPRTWSQSGVLFRKTGAGGWVLTTGDAVGTQDTVDVVFGMGTEGERTLKGRVVAHGEHEEMACLWVEGKDLPEPLPITSPPEIAEGEEVVMAGYQYEVGRTGPVTSVPVNLARLKFQRGNRPAADEEPASGTLEGDANIGRCGAPVMTAQGKFVGIADTKPTGGRTCRVAMAESIRRFFRFHLATVSAMSWEPKKDSVKLSVRAQLLDPLEQVKELTFLYIREKQVKALPPRQSWKGYTRADSEMAEAPLRIEGDVGSADIAIERAMEDAQSVRFMYQLRITETDGREFYNGTMPVDVAFAPDAAPGTGVRSIPEAPGFDIRLPAELKIGRKAGLRIVTGELLASPDGATLYLLDLTGGRVLRFEAATLNVTGEFAAAGIVRCMALTQDGKTLAVAGYDSSVQVERHQRATSIVQLISADSMKPLKELHGHGAPSAVAVTAKHVVLGLQEAGPSLSGPGLVLLDIERGTEADCEGSSSWPYIRMHPDETRVYVGDVGMSPGNVRCLPLSPNPASSRFACTESRYHGEVPLGYDLEISADGKFLVCSTGSVLRLSMAARAQDDMELVGKIDAFRCAAFAPGATSFLTANSKGFVKQYDLPAFKLRTSVSLDAACEKMVLDPRGKRLFATVSSLPAGERHSYGRDLPLCDLAEIVLEDK